MWLSIKLQTLYLTLAVFNHHSAWGPIKFLFDSVCLNQVPSGGKRFALPNSWSQDWDTVALSERRGKQANTHSAEQNLSKGFSNTEATLQRKMVINVCIWMQNLHEKHLFECECSPNESLFAWQVWAPGGQRSQAASEHIRRRGKRVKQEVGEAFTSTHQRNGCHMIVMIYLNCCHKTHSCRYLKFVVGALRSKPSVGRSVGVSGNASLRFHWPWWKRRKDKLAYRKHQFWSKVFAKRWDVFVFWRLTVKLT